MQITAVQLNITWEDKSANLATIRRLLSATDLKPGGLVVLPEMTSVGFTMDLEVADEGEDAPTERLMAEISRDRGVYVVGGVVRKTEAARGLNQSVVFDPGGACIGRYGKIHPFRYAGETEHFDAGQESVVFDWQGTAVAMTVCFDLRFPELYRVAALKQNALAAVVIANFPAARWMHWVTLLQARAIENQMFVIGVNRCGSDPNVPYPGRSMIIDPKGFIRADAGDREGIIQADLDFDELRTYRKRFPALAEARSFLIAGQTAESS